MTRRLRPAPIGCLAVAVLLLGGCGGEDPGPGTAAESTTPTTTAAVTTTDGADGETAESPSRAAYRKAWRRSTTASTTTASPVAENP